MGAVRGNLGTAATAVINPASLQMIAANKLSGGKLQQAAGNVFGPMVGASGGFQGTGIAGPSQTNITPGTNASQIQAAAAGTQGGLQAQQNLLAALQAQTPIQGQAYGIAQQNAMLGQMQGQNAVGNNTNAIAAQQNLANQLGQYNGAANIQGALNAQQDVYGQQQALANQYGNVAAGRGPNPAQAMLNQQTGENVANQAALMAGQRGAGSNVGLMARQAAQQGAATQQQAVGQGATMQAQQSLQAMQQQAAQQQAMAQTQQNIAGIGAQQVGLTAQQQQAVTAATQQQIAQQQAQQQAYNAQANTMANQQIGQTNTLAQAQQSAQQIQQNALSAQNQQNVAMQGNINSANAGLAQTTLQGRQGMIGGVMNGLGAAMGAAEGGLIEKQKPRKRAYGSAIPETATPPAQTMAPMAAQAPQAPQAAGSANPQGPQSSFGKFLNGMGQSESAQMQGGPAAINQGVTNFGKGFGKMMKSKTPISSPMPDNAYGGPDVADMNAQTVLASAKGGLASKGGHVNAAKPSQKAVKRGNSYDNDKIPAYLSEGEIVIPRSVTLGKDPVRGAADFVAKVLAKKRNA